jgi:UPF0755 protein
LDSLVRSSVVAVIVLLLAAGAAVAYLIHWASLPMPISEPVLVELAPGQPFGAFATALESVGAIGHAGMFTTYARWKGQANRVQAGEYRIVVGETPETLLADLVSGTVASYDIRIVEGSTIMRVVEQLGETQKLVDDLGPVTAATLMAKLQLGDGYAEGWFFPDTYGYKKGTRVSDVLMRANERMKAVLVRAWAERAPGLPYAAPDEALIMASIIEKETGRDADRGKISRVFVSRLQRAMRLQTDPAVIYGLGDTFDGNLTRAQLEADNPYNTYKVAGLPPTPIALPGLASIEAALHPDDGNFLYFVARGDGSSEFSATLDEHLAAVRRYQLGGRDL